MYEYHYSNYHRVSFELLPTVFISWTNQLTWFISINQNNQIISVTEGKDLIDYDSIEFEAIDEAMMHELLYSP